MNCPRCNSIDIYRSRRRNMMDDLKASMGLWPFSCRSCGRRFTANRRYAPSLVPSEVPAPSKPATETIHEGAAMAFRRDVYRPTAKVVIQADDTVQLEQILIALHRAVSFYQQPAREKSGASSR